ncbi:MAG TPA: GNAT family N-acetyltransferase [Actinomycetota bacterium]|nr:GNAT family N-acetyltransferase [Actinomycetota bacterium]
MAVEMIETPRLVLRPFAADLSDLDPLHEIQSDPVHMRHYPHPFSRDESRAWIEEALDQQERLGYSLWAIEDRDTGEVLGNCGPVPRTIDGVDEVELGWSVTPRRARQGIATEAATVWRDRCLGSLGMERVISLILPENRPSRGVAGKIGMTVWKETTHGSRSQLHLVYRVDRADVATP